MSPFASLTRPRGKALATGAVLALCIGAASLWWHGRPGSEAWRNDPLFATPALAIRALPDRGALFYNGAAAEWLLKLGKEHLPPGDLVAGATRPAAMAQAVQNPVLFRQMDRGERFTTILLVGDPSQYRPLLEHLLERKDFTLRYVDHTGLIFGKGPAAKSWSLADLIPARQDFAEILPAAQPAFLALAASKLLAVRENAPARQLLAEARKLREDVPEVWSTLAQADLAAGEWTATLTHAEKALKLDPNNLPALAAKTQAYYSTRRFNDAYALSRVLVERLPEDPYILFYHAKIAREAHAYTDESRVLEKLISLAVAQGRPVGGYRVYLGQAHASAGRAEQALEQFAKALADPDLPPEQRTFATETAALVRSKARLP